MSASNLLNHPVAKTLQSDASEAAWRTAGSQLVKLTRDPLVGLLSRHLGPDDPAMRKKIADFLATEAGTAVLAALLSIGLTAMPATAGEVPQRLARELRVKAMADMGDLVADVVMGPLRQVMAFYLQDMANAPSASPPELAEGATSTLPEGLTESSSVGGLKRRPGGLTGRGRCPRLRHFWALAPGVLGPCPWRVGPSLLACWALAPGLG